MNHKELAEQLIALAEQLLEQNDTAAEMERATIQVLMDAGYREESTLATNVAWNGIGSVLAATLADPKLAALGFRQTKSIRPSVYFEMLVNNELLVVEFMHNGEVARVVWL